MRDWRTWFTMAWRDDKRQVVLNDYAAMAQAHPLFLADLALRGNVYSDGNPPTDPVEVGIYLGRRQLALETINLCRKTPQQLQAYMTPPAQERSR